MTDRALASDGKAMGSGIFDTSHRQWPLPDAPWIMAQTWNDLLFAHWPVPVEVMRRLVPEVLPLDTFDGWAWISVVPFWMSNVRPRFVPSLPAISTFPELNVRTYVVLDGKPGVFFFSLDAANPLAVVGARTVFHLPYFHAWMETWQEGRDIRYRSRRWHPGAPTAELHGVYRPTGPVFRAERGSLAFWLAERYCLYAVDRRQRVYRVEIQHQPWPLQTADALFTLNTMTAGFGLELPDRPPLLHFCRRLDMIAYPMERVR